MDCSRSSRRLVMIRAVLSYRRVTCICPRPQAEPPKEGIESTSLVVSLYPDRYRVPLASRSTWSYVNRDAMIYAVKKNHRAVMKASSTIGLSILASGLSFVGSAYATDIVIDGSYESATNAVSGAPQALSGGNNNAGIDGGWTFFSTYNYSANYTQAGPPGSGLKYLRPYPEDQGGSQTVRQTNSLTRAISAANIDAGVGQYVISAWFSTYL